MEKSLALICAFLLISFPAGAQSQNSQDKKSDHVQIIGNGEIIKVDAKKRILVVREIADSKVTSSGGEGSDRRNDGGIRTGGGQPRNGGGYPGGGYPGGGGGYPGGGTPRTRGGGYPPGGGYPGGTGYPGGGDGYPGGGGDSRTRAN